MDLQFLTVILFTVWATEGLDSGHNIVTVIDEDKYSNLTMLEGTLKSKKLLGALSGNAYVVTSDGQNPIQTLDDVCAVMQGGAIAMLDISPPLSGYLLRSFARTAGIACLSLMDQSNLMAVDLNPDLHLAIEPPGSCMLNVISDIVTQGNLTKIAILYDRSFDLNVIPKRILTGVPAEHIYLELNGSVEQLHRLQEIEIKSFFVVASKKNAETVLGQASVLGLITEQYNWFVVTKDLKIACSRCKTLSQITQISVEPVYNQMNKYLPFIRNLSKYLETFDRDNTNVDEAFIYDLMILINEALVATKPSIPIYVPDCYGVRNASNALLEQSRTFLDFFRNVSRLGVFGPISYTNGMLKQTITLSIKRQTFQSGGILLTEQVGQWTEENCLVQLGDGIFKKSVKKTYKVVVVPRYPPFIYKGGNGTFYGYCWDLLNEIRDILGFDYEYYESPDGLVGAMDDNGEWTGVIKELIEKRADIALGPISVMAERENVVDFTVPYYDLVGLRILIKNPKFDYELFKFLNVLDPVVWICIIGSFFMFSGLLCLFDRFSPFSYQNNKDRGTEKGPEPRIFTMKEGIWFCMMSLTPQGGGEAPRALSGKLIAATWWLFGFIIIATYTANLAAFLTVSRLEEPVKSLDDLSAQYKVKYAPNNGSAAMVYFKRMADIELKFYSIWKQMSLNDSMSPVERAKLAVWDYPVSNKYTKLWKTMQKSEFPNTLEDAIKRVKTGEFAYIGDAAENKYQTLRDCDLWQVGEEFSRKPFALAVQSGSPLRSDLSNAILQLLNRRKLEELKEEWWTKSEIDCPDIEDESDGISFRNIRGVFLLIAAGSVLAFIFLGVEFYLYNYRPKKKNKEYNIAKTNSTIELVRDNSTVLTNTENGDVTIWPKFNLDFSPKQNGRNGHVSFDLNGKL